MCPYAYPLFEATPPGAAPGLPVKTGAFVSSGGVISPTVCFGGSFIFRHSQVIAWVHSGVGSFEFLGCVIDAKYASAPRPPRVNFQYIASLPQTVLVNSHGRSGFLSSSRSPSSEMNEMSALASYDCRMNDTPPKDRRGW